jgi:hypothetical protein
MSTDRTDVTTLQQSLLGAGTLVGYRAALDQSLMAEQGLLMAISHSIEQLASLLLELKNAPVTTVACPWTGPYAPSPSVP